MKKLLFFVVFACSWSVTPVYSLTQDEMEKIVSEKVDVVESKKGYVVFEYKKVRMALISDVQHDRMRIIAPVTEYSKLTLKQVNAIMESNFHRSLDARYAASQDILYSAFIHPLTVLTKVELDSALDQVATLALTFDSSYTSSELSFGGK